MAPIKNADADQTAISGNGSALSSSTSSSATEDQSSTAHEIKDHLRTPTRTTDQMAIAYREIEQEHLANAGPLIERVRKAVKSKDVAFLVDYDATMTMRFVPSETGPVLGDTAFRVIEKFSKFPQEYLHEAEKLRTHYFAIELDVSIEKEKKIPLMIEWYEKALALLVKYGAALGENFDVELMCREALGLLKDRDDVRDEESSTILQSSSEKRIQLRPGIIELIDACYAHNIPFIIVSAGIAQIVEGVLHLNNVAREKYQIWSNEMVFDNHRCLSSFKRPILHMYNKILKEDVTPKVILDKLKTKGVAITMGDSLGDATIAINAASDIKFNDVLRVGLLNHKIEESLEKYRKAFDLLYIEDGPIPSLLVDIVREG